VWEVTGTSHECMDLEPTYLVVVGLVVVQERDEVGYPPGVKCLIGMGNISLVTVVIPRL
jgi:hypothetical protein